MNPLIVTFNTKTASNSPLSRDTDSYLDDTIHNNGHCPWVEATISKAPAARFLSEMIHELRNPMTSINLSTEMLNAATKDDDFKLYLDIITRNTIRLSDMINDLIQYQQTQVEQEGHSIQQLLDEALEMTADRIMLRNITVSKNYTAPDHKIILNKPKIKIAMTNIIMNAINAMPSEKAELKLVTRSDNGKYLIEIEDNGIGISEENLKNIFKTYFTNMPGATGTGLSATLDILLSNHASVAFQSEEGKGTRFIFSFDGIQQPGVFLDNSPLPNMA